MDRGPTSPVRGRPGPPPSGGDLRFVGLGDSLTQGGGDPRPGRAGFAGQLDGWVSYVKQNWKRWREEIAASKARQSGSAS